MSPSDFTYQLSLASENDKATKYLHFSVHNIQRQYTFYQSQITIISSIVFFFVNKDKSLLLFKNN